MIKQNMRGLSMIAIGILGSAYALWSAGDKTHDKYLKQEICAPVNNEQEISLGLEAKPVESLQEIIEKNLSCLSVASEEEAGQNYHDPNHTGNPLYRTKGQDPNMQLSPHFKLKELATSGGKILPYMRVDPDLLIALEKIREMVGSEIIISGGYRSISRNREVGGSAISRHLSGDGADIYCPKISSGKLNEIILETLGSDIGLHTYKDNHIHVDVRGYHERW